MSKVMSLPKAEPDNQLCKNVLLRKSSLKPEANVHWEFFSLLRNFLNQFIDLELDALKLRCSSFRVGDQVG
jgi:hypothetical protein